MRTLIVALFTSAALAGCAAPKFDNIEYNHFVELSSWATRAKAWCGEPTVMLPMADELLHRARSIDTYASYRPAHKEIKEITALVRANVEELHKAYWTKETTPSVAYCQGKLTVIENSLQRVLPVVGGLQE